MARRIVATALWAYFAWYLVAMIAAFTGAPAEAGPIAALLMVGFALYDHRRARNVTRPAPQRS